MPFFHLTLPKQGVLFPCSNLLWFMIKELHNLLHRECTGQKQQPLSAGVGEVHRPSNACCWFSGCQKPSQPRSRILDSGYTATFNIPTYKTEAQLLVNTQHLTHHIKISEMTKGKGDVFFIKHIDSFCCKWPNIITKHRPTERVLFSLS